MKKLITLALAALPVATFAAGGAVAGKVEATPAKFLSETVVYLKDAKGPHEKKTITIDQKGMKFLPHVSAITVGDSVKFLNHDAVDHNVYSPDNGGYNLGMIKSKAEGEHVFDKAGVYQQLCSVHPEMLAYVFVDDGPYHAVVDAKGHYKIEGVPPGTYHVAIWNSHLKAADQTVTVTAGKTADANFSVKR